MDAIFALDIPGGFQKVAALFFRCVWMVFPHRGCSSANLFLSLAFLLHVAPHSSLVDGPLLSFYVFK